MGVSFSSTAPSPPQLPWCPCRCLPRCPCRLRHHRAARSGRDLDLSRPRPLVATSGRTRAQPGRPCLPLLGPPGPLVDHVCGHDPWWRRPNMPKPGFVMDTRHRVCMIHAMIHHVIRHVVVQYCPRWPVLPRPLVASRNRTTRKAKSRHLPVLPLKLMRVRWSRPPNHRHLLDADWPKTSLSTPALAAPPWTPTTFQSTCCSRLQ